MSQRMFEAACKKYAEWCEEHGITYQIPSQGASGSPEDDDFQYILANGSGELMRFEIGDADFYENEDADDFSLGIVEK